MIILAPKMGGSAYQKAAEEFQRIYRLVTGITIPVTEEPSETEDLVVIGTDAVQPYVFDRIAGGFPVRPGTDEYCILSKKEGDRTLLILGGGRGRSTLYAVYDFFERQAGCHYFWDGDVIPHREDIDMQNLCVVERPRFAYRAIRYFAHRGLYRFQAEHWDLQDWQREIDWLLKARLNVFMLRIGMDDLFQKAFPDIVPYPPENEKLPGAGKGYDNRTTAWSLQERGQLRKQVLQYAFDRDLIHPEDCGTMTHWYSRTPVEYLQARKPKLLSQASTSYSEQTGQVWDIFDDENVENYWRLTETHIREYGRPEMFHTIGLAERKFSEDPKKNLELKKYAYKRFLARIQEQYPNAKTLIAAWDFYIRLQPEEVQEIIRMFDPETTLILDYTADLKYEKSCIEKWNVVGKFPWIFGLFHAYMPQSHIHGDYEFIAEKFALADQDSFCKGMDFWPETSHSDTLMLAYFTENAWRPSGRGIEEVAREMCQKRYGLAAETMWDIWRTALPLLRLPDIDYTSCIFNLLQNMVLTQLLDQNHPHHAERVEMWQERVASQLPMDVVIGALVKAVRDLPQEWMNDPFIHRDCVDLVRSVLTQMLHIHYIRGALLLDTWRAGKGSVQVLLSHERRSC